MPFWKDLISVMKRCGGIPEPLMDSYVKTIEERNSFQEKVREQELMLAKSHDENTKAQEENAKAQEEIARLKSLTDSQAQLNAQLKAAQFKMLKHENAKAQEEIARLKSITNS